MENVLNSDKDHPEILATYIDCVMKARLGTDKLTEGQVDSYAAAAVEILRYLAVGNAVLPGLDAFAVVW